MNNVDARGWRTNRVRYDLSKLHIPIYRCIEKIGTISYNTFRMACDLSLQEFLAEMLDALHEDVNRVIDKPYVPAAEEDDASSGRSDQDLADEAWDRHVQRNRSVIVDLFQGQLKMECRCPVCNKKVSSAPLGYVKLSCGDFFIVKTTSAVRSRFSSKVAFASSV